MLEVIFGKNSSGFELGSLVKDRLTGFSGIAVGRTVWLYGCSRIGIESTKLTEDGKPQDIFWVDEQRVEVLSTETRFLGNLYQAVGEGPGGPQPDPRRRSDPTR